MGCSFQIVLLQELGRTLTVWLQWGECLPSTQYKGDNFHLSGAVGLNYPEPLR